METISANPALGDAVKPAALQANPRRLVRTRLRGAKLGAAPDRPGRFWCVVGGLRRILGNLRRALIERFRRAPKTLFVCETATLGDRRIVSVVQFERQRFLVGCGPSSVTLLAQLADAGSDTCKRARCEPGLTGDGGEQ